MSAHLRTRLLFLVTFCSFCLTSSAWAEVTLDGTLGRIGPLSGPNYLITSDMGKQLGPNLFHSFGTFNINTGESASFSGPSSITNIISRVTGSSSSWIDGPLHSEIPGANLYLINPKGLVFGPNASLDISGSFHASTADYLKLGQDGYFYATNTEKTVLTSAAPSAFGFMGTPSPITLSGSRLSVMDGKQVSLIGGIMAVSGGIIEAGGGINLVSMGSPGEVSFTPNGIDTGSAAMEDMTIAQGSEISSTAGDIFIKANKFVLSQSSIHTAAASEADGGAISLSGSQIELVEESTVQTWTAGDRKGGDIKLMADDSILVKGTDVSSVVQGNGDGGKISFSANRIEIADGGTVATQTTWDGKGGNISLLAGEVIVVSGEDSYGYPSQIGSHTTAVHQSYPYYYTYYGKGDAGSISLEAPRIELKDGGCLVSVTTSDGGGGNITLAASDTIAIAEREDFVAGKDSTTGIASFASGWGTGDMGAKGPAGGIILSAPLIELNGGGISAGTGSYGKGGSIGLLAEDLIRLSGSADISVGTTGMGDAGDISLKAPVIEITGGTGVAAVTEMYGKGGNIELMATRSVLLSGADPVSGRPTGLWADSYGIGDAGNIRITAPAIMIKDGGSLLSRAMSPTESRELGKGGSITVTASESVLLSNAFADASSAGSRDAGSVSISAPTIDVTSGSQIAGVTFFDGNAGNIVLSASNSITVSSSGIYADTYGNGRAGSITLVAPSIRISNGARVSSKAYYEETVGNGNGGDIWLHGTDSISIEDGSAIQASTWGTGAGGNILLSAPSIAMKDGAYVSSGAFLSGFAGDITIAASTLELLNASVSSKSEGTGTAGSISVQADSAKLDHSSISAETVDSDGGNVSINMGGLIQMTESEITTSVQGGLGNGGNVSLASQFTVLNRSDIIANAYGGSGGNISILSDYLLSTPDSMVQASSQLGISGTVNITSPEIDLSGSLNVLPSNYLDATSLIKDRCIALGDERGSSLVVAGRGGMPIEPDGYLSSP